MQEIITFFAAKGIAQNLNRMHFFVNKQRNWNDNNLIIVIINCKKVDIIRLDGA